MPNLITDPLGRRQLLASVNSYEPPSQFAQDLLGVSGQPEFVATDKIEYWRETSERKSAPYIPAAAHAVSLGSRRKFIEVIQGVNIALVASVRPEDVYHTRQAGQGLYFGPGSGPQTGEDGDPISAEMRKDQRDMIDAITETHEWWVCKLVFTGSLTYSFRDFDALTISIGRPSSHTITVGTLWDQAGATPVTDINTVKSVMSGPPDYLPPTVALCAPDVADFILESDYFKDRLDKRNLDESPNVSFLTGNTPVSYQGAVQYLGMLGGIPHWRYEREIDMGGGAEALIPAGTIQYVNVSPKNGLSKYSTPFHDLKIANGKPIRARYFSKMWENDYPSERQHVIANREMVLPRRPGICLSLTVL